MEAKYVSRFDMAVDELLTFLKYPHIGIFHNSQEIFKIEGVNHELEASQTYLAVLPRLTRLDRVKSSRPLTGVCSYAIETCRLIQEVVASPDPTRPHRLYK